MELIIFTRFYENSMTTQTLGLFLLAITSGTIMWISQKYLAWYSPFLVNGIAGLVIWFSALCIRYLFDSQSSQTWIHWAMILLWFALLGLNIAYSMLYGQNIPVAYVPIIVTWVMTVTLWLAWYFFFHETISRKFVIWWLMILAGMRVIVK